MDVTRFTHPIDLHAVSITDPFWQRETELVRREVIPYQWDALNDRIPGAEKSWCMHNFRLAGRIMAQSRQLADRYAHMALVDWSQDGSHAIICGVKGAG